MVILTETATASTIAIATTASTAPISSCFPEIPSPSLKSS